MFKSCCARPSKKLSKSKSKPEKMDSMSEPGELPAKENLSEFIRNDDICKEEIISTPTTVISAESEGTDDNNLPDNKENSETGEINAHVIQDVEDNNLPYNQENSETGEINAHVIQDVEKSPNIYQEPTPEDVQTENEEEDDLVFTKREITKKRYSIDYKRARLDFKRFSVDCRRDSGTLEELARLEEELAKTNYDVRPRGRRKSTGILKSTTSSSNSVEQRAPAKQPSDSEDDEVFEASSSKDKEQEGPKEPPSTPVGRDELALRRHRFFSDLVCAARAAVEHRVRFDPLGPVVADTGTVAEENGAAPSPASELEALIERLERVTSRLERLPVLRAHSPTPPRSPVPSPAGAPSPLPEELTHTDSMSVNGYQDIVQGPLQTYLQLSKQIGGDVATHANLVNAAFQAQLRYIQLAAAQGKPSQAQEMQLLAPTSDQISAIQAFREKNRASPLFNHLSAISESIPALGWVAVSPTPAPYVKEMNDAGQFYTNRVLKEWKEKNKTHVEWCRAWVQLLSDLQAYVKQYHTTGLVWSGSGSGAGAPPPPPGGMPPPPPVLPDVDFSNLSVDDRSALFAEINQGEGITSSLRKVTSDMQTHKNPQLRTGPAPFKAAPATRGPAGKPLPQPGAGTLPDKPPVFMRDGKKWLIEYQKGNSNLVVENADMNNVVYMFRCRDSALTVRGKVNGVVLDSCTKCAVVFDNLVSSVEFVNCQSVQMQVLGKVPTVSIDKTDGCQIYLSPESLDVEIVSSKSSEMNVLVPKGNGDYSEHPVPEQFKTTINTSKNGLSTTPVENKG